MTFEADGTRVIQPLDPYQGPRYTEPADDALERDVMDQISNMTAGKREDYINPTADGSVSGKSIHSFYIESEEAMYEWQTRNHEIDSRRCATVRAVCWIGTELRDPPMYDGTINVEDLLSSMEYRVVEEQRIPALDMLLKATPARWWDTHKEDLTTWDAVQPAMIHRFVPPPEFECKDLSLSQRKGMKCLELYEGKNKPFYPCVELYTKVGKGRPAA
uniref:Uncharacterized protein n=1 Tax=Picea glauca TaxID=3330 RepID=A0A101M195_PICGL|nr:hypothetical protein ABT39_MTgene3735 [Picea glauca]